MTLTETALHYMNCPKPDALTSAQTVAHLKWLEDNTFPAFVTREYACEITPESVKFSGVEIASAGLAKYISGCKGIILFALTLGTAAGTRYRALSARSVADAMIFDACAGAFTEYRCDLACGEIAKRHGGITERFSPGFGDFDLSFQPVLAELLQARNRIGLTVTENFTLVPEKSVTAVIGIRG